MAVMCPQVGKFCYNRERLLNIRALIAHDCMPAGWSAVQPEDEFVLKRSQALPEERSRQPGARRPLLPPRESYLYISHICLELITSATPACAVWILWNLSVGCRHCMFS